MVEEDPIVDNGDREQTAKLLREQDKEWERSRVLELGKDAILGPKSSPIKRSNEEDGEAKGSRRKRRKKLKHKLVEEDWGEPPLPVQQGAGKESPQDSEQLEGEALGGEQEQSIGGEEEQTEKGSSIPREQSLVQLKMTGFLDPAPSNQGWPTQDNVVAEWDENPSATIPSSRGSPCNEGGVAVSLEQLHDEHFEGGGNETDEHFLGCTIQAIED